MIIASLSINILVLIPVCAGLLLRLPQFDQVFGKDTTARQILLCMYLGILALSGSILFLPENFSAYLIPLLSLQVFYKLLSVILIKNKRTPVLWFNLVIAVFHSATLFWG